MANPTDNIQPVPNYYAVIPAGVRYCKDLEPSAKLLYGELTALSNKHGFCWASNAYFTDLYDVDERTIRRWIESLRDKGFIRVEINKNGFQTTRKIYIVTEHSNYLHDRTKMSGREDKNVLSTGQKCPPNTTSTNTNEKNNSSKGPSAQAAIAVAAAVFVEDEAKEAMKAVSKKVPAVYAVLADVDIPEPDKIEITKRYSEDIVINAIEWARSPETKITKGLVQAIKWACQNRPSVRSTPIDKSEANKALAQRYDGMKSEFGRVDALHSSVEIVYQSGYKVPISIRYDEHGFAEQLHSAMRKINIMPPGDKP